MFDFACLRSVADISRVHAERQPARIAQIHEERTTTFAELDRHTNQVAQGLLAGGLPAQARIAYLGKNSDLYFELLLGAIKARTVVIGLNWRLAPPEMSWILNDAGCEWLFVGPEYVGLVADLQRECPRLERVIAMEPGPPDLAVFTAWRDAQTADDPLLDTPLDDDVLQLYTSGTTGHPKGVQLTHANYLSLCHAAQAAGWADCEPGDVALICMPVFHVAGTNTGLLTLAQGGTALVLSEVDPGRVLELVPRHRVSHLFVVPAVILFMLQHPLAGTTDFSSLKRLSYGASPIAEDLLRRAKAVLKCPFFQLYGLTETSGAGTYLPDDAHDPARGKLRSCGVPYPGLEIRVRDAQGRDLGPDEVGEIVIRGGVVMKGYWNRPDATKNAIINEWFHTGDAGYFDRDGFLYIHDRLKDMIVSGGENIYPAEVENALFGHPAIADAAVIGVPDEKWGEAVKAIVVLKPGATAAADDIIGYARTRIAGYKVPKSIEFVAALPRNPSGKILRRELREPYWQGQSRRVH